MKDQVDYSLYLVTDSTEAILGSKDLVQVAEQALLGGRYLLSTFALSYSADIATTPVTQHE